MCTVAIEPELNRDPRGDPNFSSTVPPGISPATRSKTSRWGGRFERRVRSRVRCGGGFFSAGQQVDSDGEGKRRTGEDARVNREWARLKLLHSVQFESRPQDQPSSERAPISVRPSRQGAPHVPVQNSPVGLATSRDEYGAESAAADFFPLDGRPMATVKKTADGRSSEGE